MADVNKQVDPNGKEATNPVVINEIFEENSQEILASMTGVLQEYGIEGYTVHAFTISTPPRPNPDVCIPSFYQTQDGYYRMQCTYVTI